VTNLKFCASNGVEQLVSRVQSRFSRNQNAAGEGGFRDSSAADESSDIAIQNANGKGCFREGSIGTIENGDRCLRDGDATDEGSEGPM
jgi:hypothetical protein